MINKHDPQYKEEQEEVEPQEPNAIQAIWDKYNVNIIVVVVFILLLGIFGGWLYYQENPDFFSFGSTSQAQESEPGEKTKDLMQEGYRAGFIGACVIIYQVYFPTASSEYAAARLYEDSSITMEEINLMWRGETVLACMEAANMNIRNGDFESWYKLWLNGEAP